MNPFKKVTLNSNTIAVTTFKNKQAMVSVLCELVNLNQTLEYLKEAKGDMVVFTLMETKSFNCKIPLSNEDYKRVLDGIEAEFHLFNSWK